MVDTQSSQAMWEQSEVSLIGTIAECFAVYRMVLKFGIHHKRGAFSPFMNEVVKSGSSALPFQGPSCWTTLPFYMKSVVQSGYL